jgi:hypothetical protein
MDWRWVSLTANVLFKKLIFFNFKHGYFQFWHPHCKIFKAFFTLESDCKAIKVQESYKII